MSLRERWLSLHRTEELLTSEPEMSLADFEVREYVLGEHIYQAGDPSREVYLLLSGKVLLYFECEHGTVTVAEAKPTEFIGEISCLRGEPRYSNALVSETCRVLIIPESELDKTIVNLPRWFVSLVDTMVDRLHTSDERLTAQCLLDVNTRQKLE